MLKWMQLQFSKNVIIDCTYSQLIVHYLNWLYIIPIDSTLSQFVVHYPNSLYIIPIHCTLSQFIVHYPNSLYIFPMHCTLSQCIVHYPMPKITQKHYHWATRKIVTVWRVGVYMLYFQPCFILTPCFRWRHKERS